MKAFSYNNFPKTIREHLIQELCWFGGDIFAAMNFNKSLFNLTPEEMQTVYLEVAHNLSETFKGHFDDPIEAHGLIRCEYKNRYCENLNSRDNNRFHGEILRYTIHAQKDVQSQLEEGSKEIIVRRQLLGDLEKHYIYRCDFTIEEKRYFYVGRTVNLINRWSDHVAAAKGALNSKDRATYFHKMLSMTDVITFEKDPHLSLCTENDLRHFFSVIGEVVGLEKAINEEQRLIRVFDACNREIGGCNTHILCIQNP